MRAVEILATDWGQWSSRLRYKVWSDKLRTIGLTITRSNWLVTTLSVGFNAASWNSLMQSRISMCYVTLLRVCISRHIVCFPRHTAHPIFGRRNTVLRFRRVQERLNPSFGLDFGYWDWSCLSLLSFLHFITCLIYVYQLLQNVALVTL